MRIGVGGGLGPLRAGVSNRGVGVGVGPFSAGTSFGGGGGVEALGWLMAAAVLASLAYLAAAWPFLAGTWLAVKLGADDPSAARSIAGWAAELLYLVVIVSALTSGVRVRRRAVRTAQRVSEAARLSRFQAQLTAVVDAVHLSEQAVRPVAFVIPDVQLIGPGHRRGDPAVLDSGRLQVNDLSAQFVGTSRTAEWRWASVVSWVYDDVYLAIEVTSRETTLGVRSGNGVDDALLIGLEWMRSGGQPEEARTVLVDLGSLLHDVTAVRAELVRAR